MHSGFVINPSFVICHSSFNSATDRHEIHPLLSLPLYALDQLTKLLVLRFINPDEPRVLVPDFFSLVNVTNTGAAFGSFRGNNTFFIVISSVALVVVLGLLAASASELIIGVIFRWRFFSPGSWEILLIVFFMGT